MNNSDCDTERSGVLFRSENQTGLRISGIKESISSKLIASFLNFKAQSQSGRDTML